MRRRVISSSFVKFQDTLDGYIENFEHQGTPFGNQDRNSLKLFEIESFILNVKSFKIPNLINQFVYRFFRKSKAQRSYEYAEILIDKGIGTPKPLAYYEFMDLLRFGKSYYISEQIHCDYTYRDLTNNFSIENYEEILRAFTRFTFNLHENEVNFLDHSPGNTLIKKTNDGFDFYLVDLNRMKFGPLSFDERMRNFSKLTIHESMIKIMSDEYSKCLNIDYKQVFELMWKYTQSFQEAYHRKRRLKKKLKFWKS